MIDPAVLQPRIDLFKKRLESEKEFCEQLFEETTTKLLACKYAYYVHLNQFVKDEFYDGLEESWYIMGRALNRLQEDETSPCVDWNENHPMAKKGIELANQLMSKPRKK